MSEPIITPSKSVNRLIVIPETPEERKRRRFILRTWASVEMADAARRLGQPLWFVWSFIGDPNPFPRFHLFRRNR